MSMCTYLQITGSWYKMWKDHPDYQNLTVGTAAFYSGTTGSTGKEKAMKKKRDDEESALSGTPDKKSRTSKESSATKDTTN